MLQDPQGCHARAKMEIEPIFRGRGRGIAAPCPVTASIAPGVLLPLGTPGRIAPT